MMVYPIVSTVNGTTVAGHATQEGAIGVASALVRHAGGADIAYVGEPFETELTGGMLVVDGVTVPFKPVYALAKDPYRLMVTRLLDMARAPRKRGRKSATARTAATGAGKGVTDRKPATTGRGAARKPRTTVKAGGNA